ncbi:MAG: Fic family protein [Raoultibacter sp.]
MTQEDALFYAKRNLVDSIWKEALIEGIDVTFPDTNEIIEGRAVAGISVDGIIIINNLKHGWQFITSAIDAEVDLNFVRQVNMLVGRDGAVNYPGELRLYEVKMGGTQWKPELPDYDQAKTAIAKIASEPMALDRAFNMFAYICRAQLFSDGNKRTAQLVANKMLIRDGQGILAIPDSEKALFGNLLIDFYETGCNKALSAFLYEKCLDGHDSPSLVASDMPPLTEGY